ncbi:MAG: fibronectin type III domain-containing protein, partial [Desulfotomaculaceae bacterium]|nr:fibronectin type III domain-containing protein [Desulfotomaculaceae bacterium]
LLTEETTDNSVTEDETEESNDVVSDIVDIDECIIPQEEKGLTVSLDENYDLIPVVVLPTVQTDAATNIGMESAILHGSINNTGGEYCDQRKFRIRAQGNESWSDAGIETGSFGSESFSFTITGLHLGTIYEYKAMAYNLAGWGEGSVTTFTAAASQEKPVEVKPAEVDNSCKKSKQDKPPQKTPYDIYRSNYWRWLGGLRASGVKIQSDN